MKKIYRGLVKLIQYFNYWAGVRKIGNSYNLMSTLDDNGERLTDLFAKDLSRGIRVNKCFPAGKTIEFEVLTNTITLEVLYKTRRVLDIMDNLGTSGIDVYYEDTNHYVWMTSVVPENNYQMYVKKSLKFQGSVNKVKLYLPSFALIQGIYVCGQQVKCIPTQYTADIVVYGSSITQGCAASRPGMNYVNQLSVKLKCKVRNYGFSESAKGETKIIEYIAKNPSKVFIMEYDHNASLEELYSTHQKVYETIRKYFGGWIIMMTRFSGGLSISLEEERERVQIVNKTYNFAIDNGDHKIIFIDGSKVFTGKKNDCFVDKVHLNDKGMTEIADMLCCLISREGMLNGNK